MSSTWYILLAHICCKSVMSRYFFKGNLWFHKPSKDTNPSCVPRTSVLMLKDAHYTSKLANWIYLVYPVMSGHWTAELYTQKRGFVDEESVRENSRNHRRQWPEGRTLPGLLEDEEGDCGLWKRDLLRRRGIRQNYADGQMPAARNYAPFRVGLESEGDGVM